MHKVDFQNPNNKTMHTNELIPQKQQQQIQNKCSKKLLVTTQLKNSRTQQNIEEINNSRIQQENSKARELKTTKTQQNTEQFNLIY
jgi:hypothetical protein